MTLKDTTPSSSKINKLVNGIQAKSEHQQKFQIFKAGAQWPKYYRPLGKPGF
jgi:hypothetical protein